MTNESDFLNQIASRARPLRVLALATEAWGGRGGIAQSTRDLLSALASMPDVGQIDIFPRLAPEVCSEMPDGIHQYPSFHGRLGYSWRAIGLALRLRPDVVYCGHTFMAPLAHLVSRLSGARLVSHVHGLEVWKPLTSTVRRALAASDLILCVSQHTAGKVVAMTGATSDRCAVIYNTVEDRFVPGDRNAARAHFGVGPDAIVLSTVSRLDSGQRHKGHDRVIPLLADLAKIAPGLTYLVAGTGGDRDRLQAIANDTGAAEIVRFLGYVPTEDLPDLYRASDLYVMPSHGEGFGIAFVEAMACGTPALGLDVGGARDALRNGELGQAVAEAEFPAALCAALTSRRTSPADLAFRTRDIFGLSQYVNRLSDAFTPVIRACFSKNSQNNDVRRVQRR